MFIGVCIRLIFQENVLGKELSLAWQLTVCFLFPFFSCSCSFVLFVKGRAWYNLRIL